MSKAEWGLKRICPSCGAKYYDMKKKAPVCPSCGTVYDPEAVMKSRRGRASAKPAPVEAREEVVEDVIPEGGEEEAEEALIEDAEELGDDDAAEDIEVEKES